MMTGACYKLISIQRGKWSCFGVTLNNFVVFIGEAGGFRHGPQNAKDAKGIMFPQLGNQWGKTMKVNPRPKGKQTIMLLL